MNVTTREAFEGFQARETVMAELKAKSRNKLPKSDFAEPDKRAYPIEDKAHARNAKARAVRRPRRAGCRRPKNAKSTRRRTRF